MSHRRQFLIRLQAVRPAMLSEGPEPREEQLVGEHFRYLQQLAEAGSVLLAGRTQTSELASFGLVLLLAEDEQQARQIMQRDPAVAERVMRAELYPFRVAVLGKLDQRLVED